MRKVIIILGILAVIGIILFGIFEYETSKNHETITLYGNVDVRQVDLGFRVPGQVEALHFEEGDLVQPGKLLALLDKQPYADQVQEALANVESVKASLKNAEITLKRRQELISNGSVSQEDLDNALANTQMLSANLKQVEAALSIAHTNLEYTQIFAPTEGTILTRIREPGSVVNAGEPVYTLSV